MKKLIYIIISTTLLACSKAETTPSSSSAEPFEVHCAVEPLPAFTLDYSSNPTEEQQAALCACIWQNLGSWERSVSEQIHQGKSSNVSELHKRAFPSRFGNALEKCGGMDF